MAAVYTVSVEERQLVPKSLPPDSNAAIADGLQGHKTSCRDIGNFGLWGIVPTSSLPDSNACRGNFLAISWWVIGNFCPRGTEFLMGCREFLFLGKKLTSQRRATG